MSSHVVARLVSAFNPPARVLVQSIFALVLVGSALRDAAAQEVPLQSTERSYVRGRVLVKPRIGLSDVEFDRALKVHGGKRAREIAAIGVHLVELPAAANERAVAMALAKNPHFESAELDLILESTFTPSDPYYPSQWHEPKVGAPSAWDITAGAGVTVAILDSGVDASHPDLVANIVPGWNVYGNDGDTRDVFGHGTKVAGTVAASGNNAAGVAGVAFSSKIMPIRVSDSSGSATSSALAQGLAYAADHGARVANMSFRGLNCSSTIVAAAKYLRSKGGVAVGSAGNTGGLLNCPASEAIVTVAATTSSDVRASYSSYGPFMSVAAPGSAIYTTVKGGTYGSVSGTSFSSPIAASVYALMIAANPALQPSELDSILFSTAKDLGSAGWDQYYGWGRIDAYAAVTKATQSMALDTVNPTVAFSAPTGGKISGLVPVNITASDDVGVTQVSLYAGSTLIATDSVSPYAFSVDTTPYADGALTFTARAFDAAGNYASNSVSVTVANDTKAPVVAVSNPVSGSTVSGAVVIAASATDNQKVSQMTLTIDGRQVAIAYGGSLAYTWSTTTTTTSKIGGQVVSTTTTLSGAHTIVVRAIDPAGNVGSKFLNVTVE